MCSSGFGIKHLLQAIIILSALFMVSTAVNAAAPPRSDVWQPNGPVRAVALSKEAGGNTAYIGGDFTYVGPDTGNAVEVSTTATGSHLPSGGDSWPKFDGAVHTVISDGGDGWYVGGAFTTINDGAIPRNRLARIVKVDGAWTVHAWDPNVNNTVRTLVLDSLNNRLYIGGDFTGIDAGPVLTRNRLAALDTTATTSGSYDLGWDPNAGGGIVRTIASDAAGTTLYVGGDFSTIGGQPRDFIAAIDSASGTVTLWDPDVNDIVRTLVYDPLNTRVYAGGDFTSVNVTADSQLRPRLAAFDTTATDNELGWNPDADASVNSLAISGNTLFVGGDFANINGASRNGFAAMDITDIITSPPEFNVWDAPAPPFVGATNISVSQIVVSGSLYIAWNGTLGTTLLGRMHALRLSDGTYEWVADAGGPINTIWPATDYMFIGGDFSSGGGRIRSNLAEINIGTLAGAGAATEWSAYVDGPVHSIVAKDDGNAIYIGGTFTEVGSVGITRNNIAQLPTDGDTVFASAWDPSITGTSAVVRAMALSPGQTKLYVGGTFDDVAASAGGPRSNIAALDTTVDGTGGVDVLINNWMPGSNPGANGDVNALVMSSDGGLLFAGGSFTSIAGEIRSQVAAVKVATGTSLSDALWAVTSVNGVVRTLSLSSDDSQLFLGGSFTQVADGTAGSPYTRNRIAALEIDTTSNKWGVATAIDPDVSTGTSVYSLGLSTDDQMLWIGGEFTDVAGSGRNRLARYNLTEPLLTDWNPNVSAGTRIYASERTADDSLVIMGGDFTMLGGVPHKHLAVFETTRPTATDTVAGGFYAAPVDVALSCAHAATAGPCSIFYTIDGTDPTQALVPYDYVQPPPSPPDPPPPPTTLTISTFGNTELKFFARDAHGSVSEIISVTYGIDGTFPTTSAQPDVILPDVLFDVGVPEVADTEVLISLVCTDGGGANCDKTYFTTDNSAPHNTIDNDGTKSATAQLYATPLTPKQLLPLKSSTLEDLVGDELDVFYDMTLADIISTEENAAFRVNLDAFYLDDVPRNAVALNSIDLNRVRAFVDLAEVRLDSISSNVLDNVVAPANVPAGAVTLADIAESDLDLTQITLGAITSSAYSLADIPASAAPPPTYILASQVPLIQVFLDNSESRIVLDAVRPDRVSLEQIPAEFIPATRLYGLVNLQFFSIDRAGNSEASTSGSGVKSQKYYVDIGPPKTTATPNTDDNVFTSDINVVLACKDFEDIAASAELGGATGSGCNSTYYTIDGTPPTPADAGKGRSTEVYTGPIPISKATVLRFMSVDNIGNEETSGFEVYAFTFSSVGQSGVGTSGLAIWLFALLGLVLRWRVTRTAPI